MHALIHSKKQLFAEWYVMQQASPCRPVIFATMKWTHWAAPSQRWGSKSTFKGYMNDNFLVCTGMLTSVCIYLRVTVYALWAHCTHTHTHMYARTLTHSLLWEPRGSLCILILCPWQVKASGRESQRPLTDIYKTLQLQTPAYGLLGKL